MPVGRLVVMLPFKRAARLAAGIILLTSPSLACREESAPAAASSVVPSATTVASVAAVGFSAAPEASVLPPWQFPSADPTNPTAPPPDPTKFVEGADRRCKEKRRLTLFIFHGTRLMINLAMAEVVERPEAFDLDGKGRKRSGWPLAQVARFAPEFERVTVWPCQGTPLRLDRARVMEKDAEGKPRLVLTLTGKDTAKIFDRTEPKSLRLKNIAAVVVEP